MTEDQQRLLELAVAEAKRDSEFGRALRRAVDDVLPKKRTRRKPAVVDVFGVYEAGGEAELRRALQPLTVDQLKDVIAQHRMDRSQLAMKWRTPDKLADLIVSQTVKRAHKGEAFMGG
jgi:uncharacterized coiled-coil protein SlyX